MSGSQAGTINVQGVSKWFGSVVAVNDVSFQVRPGITGLLGPNGAGKSTILHMITGKASCSEGSRSRTEKSVRVAGTNAPHDRFHDLVNHKG